ncbi:hypothetical protein MRX96_056337 [Rhipicephalus microplus]
MAGKAAKGTNRLENDIFKCRDESNWKKIQELAEQLMQRGTGPQSGQSAICAVGHDKCFTDRSSTNPLGNACLLKEDNFELASR